nr:hypothetical protein [Tanacetum cinerariifolium]
MASEQSSSGPTLNDMTPGTISSGLVRTPSSSTSYVPPSRNDWDLLFQSMFDELLNPPPSVFNQAAEVIAPITEVIPQVDADSTGSPSSTTVDQDAPSPSKSLTPTEIQSSVILQDVGNDNLDMEVAHMGNDPLLGVPIPEVTSEQSSSTDLLFQPMFDELLNPLPSVVNLAPEVIAPIAEVIPPVHIDSTGLPSSTTVDQDAPSPSKSHTTTEIQSSIIPQDVRDDNLDMEVAHIRNDRLFGVPIPEVTFVQSSSTVSPKLIVQKNHPIPHHNSK